MFWVPLFRFTLSCWLVSRIWVYWPPFPPGIARPPSCPCTNMVSFSFKTPPSPLPLIPYSAVSRQGCPLSLYCFLIVLSALTSDFHFIVETIFQDVSWTHLSVHPYISAPISHLTLPPFLMSFSAAPKPPRFLNSLTRFSVMFFCSKRSLQYI